MPSVSKKTGKSSTQPPERPISDANNYLLVSIEDELKQSYLDYAMSVIISRALPDVRDGLKPVHRRILYAMAEDGFDHNKPHKKSARAIGQVIAKYHPHGNEAIYGALVRMAQDFSMRICLVDGHGNFGSMDGDKAAAMRYTEVRLAPISQYLLEDYDRETVDFQENYDATLQMPSVLPARFPNLLVNGASGIAVGMATNIPPHSLGEVIDACCALIDDSTLEDFSDYIQGPDFPTGGIILGKRGLAEAYATGKGSFILRGKAHVEDMKKDRQCIVITEIPYQVNKSAMLERMAELVNKKELEGISDIRDETDRHGVRVVIELKRDAIAEVVLNRLYAMTPLQSSFSMNMLALHQGCPMQLRLRDMLEAFIVFRREVVIRRTQYFLRKTRERAYILVAMGLALDHIDAFVRIIKTASSPSEAVQKLVQTSWALQPYLKRFMVYLGEEEQDQYILSEHQGRTILAMRLQQLTNLEKDKIFQELSQCERDIDRLSGLLRSQRDMDDVIKEELLFVKDKFAKPRLTTIEDYSPNLKDEDFIQCEDMVVTVSLKGYIKRVPLESYRSQKHGGRGKNAMNTHDTDEVAKIFVADTHTLLLVFTSYGKAYQLKVHELPLGSPTSRGKHLLMLFPMEEGETLATILPLPKDHENNSSQIIFATSLGSVRKNALSDFFSIRANGKRAMKLDSGERLISVCLAANDQDVLLSSRDGKTIRFPVESLRQFSSRHSTGVRGITLKKGVEMVAMNLVRSCPYTQEQLESYRHANAEDTAVSAPSENLSKEVAESMRGHEEFILTISDRGYGKRTSSYFYRCSNRAGQGVATMEVNARTGNVVNVFPVKDEDQILLLTDQGQLLRCPVKDIRITGRKTQGVKLFRLGKDERIVSIAVCDQEENQFRQSEKEISSETDTMEVLEE